MKKTLVTSLVLTCVILNLLGQSLQQEASANRGRLQYYAGAVGPASNLGYSIRSADGGGWMWQFVDYTNNSFFNVKYPNGYVGLGVADPLAKLHISNSNAREALRVYLDGNTTNYLSMWQGTGAAALDPIGTGKIYIGYDMSTEVYLSANGGKVGIGTTSFGNEKLSVVADAQWQLRLRDSGAGGGDWRLGATSNNWGVTNGKFVISNSDLSTNAAFVIDNAKNVGIGTTSPGTRLQVEGAGGLTVDLKVTGRIQSGDANSFGGMWVNSPGTMFMGQQGASNIGFYNNGAWRLVAAQNGNVGIGTASPDQKLTVKGKIHTEEVIIDLSVPAPDYVFEKNYPLTPLDTLQAYIAQHKHLPEVPSAKQMEKDGVKVGEMEMILLKKIEELTLYVIELKTENQSMKTENEELKRIILERISALENTNKK